MFLLVFKRNLWTEIKIVNDVSKPLKGRSGEVDRWNWGKRCDQNNCRQKVTEWQKCYICIGTLETHECDNLAKHNIKTQNKCLQKNNNIWTQNQKYINKKSKWSQLKWCHYIPPRIPLCEYSKDSCNITVIKINEFVSGKICFLYQRLRNSSKVRFRLQFVYVGIVYVPWSVVWTWWRIAREWRLEVPKKVRWALPANSGWQ